MSLLNETLQSFGQIARALPPGNSGRPVNPSTIFRWAFRGVRGIRLEVIRCGGRWLSSREAVQRFVDALSSQGTQPEPQPTPTPQPEKTRRQRSRAKAEAVLDAAGIK